MSVPDLLSFAGIAPIVVPVLPLEQQVAEKLHAYTRRYAGTRESTRVKDLIDLVLIATHTRAEAGRLRQALDTVFGSRGAHSLPATLPSPPPQWGTAYRKLATEVGVNPDISAGWAVAGAFLNPSQISITRGGGSLWSSPLGRPCLR